MTTKTLTLEEIYETIQSPMQQIEEDLNTFEDLLKSVTFSPAGTTNLQVNDGKKIRAALLLFSAGQLLDFEPAVKAGTAIEMLHFASLVHDDILDHESERRGEDPVYKQLTLKKALLMGDYIMAQALLSLPEQIYTPANQALQSIVSEMCVGEFIQLHMKENVLALADYKQAYYDVNFKKTALLFSKACALGSMLNPKIKPSAQEAFAKYGENFGMAFQFLDDALEIIQQLQQEQDTRVFDAAQGIITLPYIIYAQNVLQITTLEQLSNFKQELALPERLTSIHQNMKRAQVFNQVYEVIDGFLQEANKSLAGINQEHTKQLRRMCDFLRQKSQNIIIN